MSFWNPDIKKATEYLNYLIDKILIRKSYYGGRVEVFRIPFYQRYPRTTAYGIGWLLGVGFGYSLCDWIYF